MFTANYFRSMRQYATLTAFLFISQLLFAQVAINSSNLPPHQSSMLDISSLNKGLLIPRMSTSSRSSVINPARGLMVYDSTTASVWYYDSYWHELLTSQNSDQILQIQTNTPASFVMAQNSADISDSSGYIFDSGGGNGNYSNNENKILILSFPEASQGCQIKVLSFATELNADSLYIYKSDGKGDTIILTGNQSNQSFFLDNTDGSVVFQFKSNNTNNTAGFQIRFDHIFLPSTSSGRSSAALTGFYYIPSKVAMRGGLQTNNGWSQDSVGAYSFGYGYGSKAKGDYSLSLGYGTRADEAHATAFGLNTKALGYASTAIGVEALATGYTSVAIGDGTISSGTGSIAFGYGSVSSGEYASVGGLYSRASGSASTSFGNNAVASGESAVAMGGYSIASGHNSTALGLFSTAKGFASTVIGLYNDSLLTSDETTISTNSPIFIIGNGSSSERSNAMVVRKNGNVGIGINASSFKLAVDGAITATGFNSSSDIRYKTNITPVSNALTAITNLTPIYYHWKEGFKKQGFTKERQIGFSAQEIEKYFPEMVQTDADGYKSVDYSKMTSVLVQAVKEQQKQIEELKMEKLLQEKTNNELLNRIEKIEKQLGSNAPESK